VEELPVFCLFACYEKDCALQSDGFYRGRFSDEIKEMISKHFPSADTVAVISNPYDFVSRVCSTIGTECKADLVHYFNIIPKQIENDQVVNDMEYINYLMQDVQPVQIGKKKRKSFYGQYMFRALQCKDKFFENEQEYRFILLNEKTEKPREFDIDLKNLHVELHDLDFFNDK